jgi:hypothetical protein
MTERITLRDVLARVRAEGGVGSPVLVKLGETRNGSLDRPTLVLPPEAVDKLPEELGDCECVLLRSARRSRSQPLRLTVGRGRDCDIVIADASVSKLHATVTVDSYGDAVAVRDERSRNGTLIDGARVAAGEERGLGTLSRVSFGTASYLFVDASTLRKLAQIG